MKTPLLFNKRLWETSGHWGKYRENMFLVVDSESDPALPLEDRCCFSLKPMNCPSHHLIYKMGRRSYRELPLRYYTTDALHRNEASGSLGGLTRVRQFEQDDSHIYLMESQIGEEAERYFALTRTVYQAFGLSYAASLGTRPEQRIGDDSMWDRAEAAPPPRHRHPRHPLDRVARATAPSTGPRSTSGSPTRWGAPGRPAPSSSTSPRPERFDLTYVGDDNAEHRPVVIHRAVYGSFERFIAILTEHYAGAFPAWLSPVQARVLMVSERFDAWGREVRRPAQGGAAGASSSTTPPTSSGAKIRNAELAKIPFALIVGREGGRGEGRGAAPPRRGGPEDHAPRELPRAAGQGSAATVLRRSRGGADWPIGGIAAAASPAAGPSMRPLTQAMRAWLTSSARCPSRAVQRRLLRPAGEVSRPG